MSEIKISRKERLKGDDGYKTFSVRLKESIVNDLEALVKDTGRSRNELINIILEYGLQNVEIED